MFSYDGCSSGFFTGFFTIFLFQKKSALSQNNMELYPMIFYEILSKKAERTSSPYALPDN